MHAHHYLGEANTKTLLYKLCGENCMIHPSVQHSPTLTHSNLPTAKPLAHAQLSNTFWSMPNVNFSQGAGTSP